MAEAKPVLDGNCTSYEWLEAKPTICVLPIGTFEQHSRHLPLMTDNILAEHFARFLAAELGAALLPIPNYGTSLEQTGFMGTVTLRPETFMQIIRDIADAVEEQGFTRMIVVNTHGGNFSLGPVVRDINRMNRPLKIVLAAPGASVDGSCLESPKLGRQDIHAGEYETSVMLSVAPELVKPGGVDMAPTEPNFRQPDLNMFGMGWNAPEGAYGSPSLASKEKGDILVASSKKGLVRHVRERLAWLDKNDTYAGKDMNER